MNARHTHNDSNKDRPADRLKPLKMPINPDDALRGALSTPLPDDEQADEEVLPERNTDESDEQN